VSLRRRRIAYGLCDVVVQYRLVEQVQVRGSLFPTNRIFILFFVLAYTNHILYIKISFFFFFCDHNLTFPYHGGLCCTFGIIGNLFASL